MAENLVTPEKSLNENDILYQLTYKELQQLAMSFKLPANLKHSSLVALVKARQSEDFDVVDRIVSENRQLRSRGRLSQTTSTSPPSESQTFSPPISPECLLQMPLPLASSSPKYGNSPKASKPLLVANESIPQTVSKNEQTEECTDVKPAMLDTAVHLLCKETLQPHEDREIVGSSRTHSSDPLPDPLELESPSTYCSNSRTNSAASDIDPLVTVKECLDFSEKDTLAKDLTELKPVPPSELMDLSISEPLLDSSLILKPTFGSVSPQADAFLPPADTLTQTLMQYPSVEDAVITNNPIVNLCAPDSTINGPVNLPTENKRGESTKAKQRCSDVIPLENVNAGVRAIASQNPNSQKRQSIESDYSPSKLQKTGTLGFVQQSRVLVSTVSSSMPLVSRGEFPQPSSSLSIVSGSATICSSAATQASVLPESVVITTSSFLEGEKVEPSIPNTSTLSANTCYRSTNPNARKNIVYFSTSPVTSSLSNLPVQTYSQSTKTFPLDSWLGALPRPNTHISESNLPPVPKKVPGRNILLLSKGSANKLSTPSKKSNTVKSSHQEVCYLSPDMAHIQFRSMAAKSQASPVRMSMASPICSAISNTPYARQHIRPSSQHPISAVTASTVSLNAPRRSDQAAALPSNHGIFATPTLPTRNPPNIATPIPRPARPESVVNIHPPLHTPPNLPPFNHFLRDQADNQKYGQGRQTEVCATHPVGHGDSTGEPLPSPVQPRVDLGCYPPPHLTPQTRHSQMDFPPTHTAPVESTFVGLNLAAVGQNFSHDSCPSTLRQLLEAPVYNGHLNRDPGRRNQFNTYQHDCHNNSQFMRPQPSDHHKDMTGIGQTGNHSFQTQNLSRMPFMPLKPPESTERLLKTKEFLAEQRLGTTDVPRSLESIFNYRNDAVSALSTFAKHAVRSRAIDSLFVSSGIGSTHSVYCYAPPICSVKSKPIRTCHMGIGSYQAMERHRSPQEFVPYSSNFPAEQQSTDMYSPSSQNQQLCEPSWFTNEPCLPAALPVNQYWPQAASHQPAMRLPQPFRAVNPRNMPNQYYSPLKSLQIPNAPAFFNQPPINNVGYQGSMVPPPPPLPLPDVQSYQSPESFDKVLPLQENMAQLVGQDPLTGPNQAMNQCQNQIHQDVPDFQGRSDQLSLSMIYNYLASTEHQMAANSPRPDHFDNQSQINQRPVYSRPIFPGPIAGQYQQQIGNGGAASTTTQQSPAVASAPATRSKYSNAPAKNVARRQEVSQGTTLTKEAATLSVIALRKQNKERQKCVNFENGCSLTLPLSQLAAHEQCCEYINLKCPKETCEWNGRARKLANHVREVHRAEINSGTDSKHSLPDIEALERVCFLQEVSRKLFAICVNCHGGVLYVSIQYIASGRSERPTSASGCIEVLGYDGHPHSWRGKLLPYYQSVEALLTTSSCLEVNLSTLGAFAGSTVTLHVNIRVYSGNTNSNAQPSH